MKIRVGDVRISCAHFIEMAERFERLHGHNLTISAQVSSPEEDDMVMDFRELESALQEVASSLDHRLLLPGRNPGLSIGDMGTSYEILAGKKRYRMPKGDIVILPIRNSTVEEIGRHLHKALSSRLPKGVSLTRLTVEEIEGKEAIIESS